MLKRPTGAQFPINKACCATFDHIYNICIGFILSLNLINVDHLVCYVLSAPDTIHQLARMSWTPDLGQHFREVDCLSFN